MHFTFESKEGLKKKTDRTLKSPAIIAGDERCDQRQKERLDSSVHFQVQAAQGALRKTRDRG